MKSRTEIEQNILKWGYIITIIVVILPFINHIFYDLRYERHIPLSDLGDVIEVCFEALTIFLLGFFSTRTLSGAIKRNRELEEKHQKEKEEMNNKIIESVMEAQEKERKKISREMHNGVGQNLSIVKMNLEMATKKSNKNLSKDFNSTINLINESIQELKKLSMDVRPSILDDLGLVPTLRWYIKNCSASTGVKIIFTGNIECRLSPGIETNIYRIIQEALSNALKHSKAKVINIFIKAENNELFLSIKDNGKGFEPEKYLTGMNNNNKIGIVSIKERVTLMNGALSIKSDTGKGTGIEIKIPIKRKDNANHFD
ncbi:MAG: sensor histidine kinase [bacterium]